MAMPDEASVIEALKDPANPNAAAYQSLFFTVFGIDLSRPVDVTYAYNSLAKAIAAFERSRIFKSFNSKYDAFIAMQEEFTDDELAGYEIFKEDTPLPDGTGAGKCFLCHPEPLFTDFTYDNLGIPKSKNKLIKHNPVDLGLGGVLDDPNEDGKFKVSSLRNLTFTPPYGHNGYFTSLEEIVHFYNTRDVKAEKWPAPEVSANVNHDELGNLGLTAEQEAQLVTFLKTLSDRPGMPSYPPTLR
jgi:cytochrome c peroxidase